MANPRVSVSSLSSWPLAFEDDIALWRELGINYVGVVEPKLEAFGWNAAKAVISQEGLRVSSLSCVRSTAATSLEFCPEVGADVWHVLTGGYGPVPWEEAASSFGREMGPVVSRAATLGVRVAVEPTNPLRADVSFLHSVLDAVELADRCGLGVVIDLSSTWHERNLETFVRDRADLVALVQVSDYKLGTFDTPNRSVVGDGDIPIERILASILEGGYQGPFEIEVMGPRIEAEGYRSAIGRSIERTSRLLERLGA